MAGLINLFSGIKKAVDIGDVWAKNIRADGRSYVRHAYRQAC